MNIKKLDKGNVSKEKENIVGKEVLEKLEKGSNKNVEKDSSKDLEKLEKLEKGDVNKEVYKCKRCGLEFDQKKYLVQHLNKKIICMPIEQEIDRELLIEEVNRKEGIECSICKNIYKNEGSLKSHKCKKDDALEEVLERLNNVYSSINMEMCRMMLPEHERIMKILENPNRSKWYIEIRKELEVYKKGLKEGDKGVDYEKISRSVLVSMKVISDIEEELRGIFEVSEEGYEERKKEIEDRMKYLGVLGGRKEDYG